MRAKGYWQKASESAAAAAGIYVRRPSAKLEKIAVCGGKWGRISPVNLIYQDESEKAALHVLCSDLGENERERREDAPHRFATSIFLFYNKLLKLLLQTQTRSERGASANYAATCSAK